MILVKACLLWSLALMIEAFLKCQCSLDDYIKVRLNKADLELYMSGWGFSAGGAQFRVIGGDLVFSLANQHVSVSYRFFF